MNGFNALALSLSHTHTHTHTQWCSVRLHSIAVVQETFEKFKKQLMQKSKETIRMKIKYCFFLVSFKNVYVATVHNLCIVMHILYISGGDGGWGCIGTVVNQKYKKMAHHAEKVVDPCHRESVGYCQEEDKTPDPTMLMT